MMLLMLLCTHGLPCVLKPAAAHIACLPAETALMQRTVLCKRSDSCGCAQATIDTWRLGWNFTAGETLTANNIFTAGIDPFALNASNVQLESRSANESVQPFAWTSVSFLGTKSTAPAAPAAPFRARCPLL